MTSAQIVGLSNAQLSQLTTAQLSQLTTTSVLALSSAQIASFTTSQVAGLTTSVIASLSATQKMGLTSDIPAMTTSQITALYQSQISPLVLDLQGVDALTTANVAGLAPSALSVLTSTDPSSGIQTQMIGRSGVNFDLGNTGATNASVGWITPGEGFLVNLPTGATTITNGSELFGTATVLPNGQTAPDGFAALSAFDQNGNGVINASDPIFNQLQVWVDTGTNGTTPTGSLFTLSQLNIQSLNLSATVAGQSNNGNTIGLVSSYTTTDGKTHELADVWLASSSGTGSTVAQLTQALSQYAASGSAAQTSGLNSVASASTSSVAGVAGVASASSATSASTSVLANALSQYDANGQLVSAAATTQVASTTATSATSQLMGQTSSTQTTVTKNGGNSN
jgi:hypothetical protein